MPATVEHYIHRVGRTARAGRVGVSVSLAGEGERKIVKDVIKKASNPVKMRIIATGKFQAHGAMILIFNQPLLFWKNRRKFMRSPCCLCISPNS